MSWLSVCVAFLSCTSLFLFSVCIGGSMLSIPLLFSLVFLYYLSMISTSLHACVFCQCSLCVVCPCFLSVLSACIVCLCSLAALSGCAVCLSVLSVCVVCLCSLAELSSCALLCVCLSCLTA